MISPRQEDARRENTKINYGMDTTEEKEKRTPKENVDGRSTSSHDNKKFRTRSVEKQTGIALGFRKTETAVKKYRIDRQKNFGMKSHFLQIIFTVYSFLIGPIQ